MSYHDRYEAVARLYVDTKSVLRPLMRDWPSTPTPISAAMLSKTLITRPNIEQLVRNLKLDADAKDQDSRDNKEIQSVMLSVKIASLGRDNIYDFTYRDVDVDHARDVVQGLVSMFLNADAESRQRDTKLARDFIDGQVRDYEAKLAEAESRLKDFKLRNLGISVAGGKDYFSRITALEEEQSKVTLELRAAEQSRDALRRELGGEMPPQLLDSTISEGSAVSSEFTRVGCSTKAVGRAFAALHGIAPRCGRNTTPDHSPGRTEGGRSRGQTPCGAGQAVAEHGADGPDLSTRQTGSGRGRGQCCIATLSGRRYAGPTESAARIGQPYPASRGRDGATDARLR